MAKWRAQTTHVLVDNQVNSLVSTTSAHPSPVLHSMEWVLLLLIRTRGDQARANLPRIEATQLIEAARRAIVHDQELAHSELREAVRNLLTHFAAEDIVISAEWQESGSINVTLDGAAIVKFRWTKTYIITRWKRRIGRCSAFWPGDLRNDGGSVSAAGADVVAIAKAASEVRLASSRWCLRSGLDFRAERDQKTDSSYASRR